VDSLHDIEVLIESNHRLIVVETEREGCFIEGFKKLARHSSLPFFIWTSTRGLSRLAEGYSTQTINKDIPQLFSQIENTQQRGVYVLVDFHPFLADPISIRHIKDVLFNKTGHHLILLSQKIEIPQELRTFAIDYELPLPDKTELKRIVNDLAVEWLSDSGSRLKVEKNRILDGFIKGLCGLTASDATRLARHAIFDDGIISEQDVKQLGKSKFELINQDEVLEYEMDYQVLDDLAGFDNLKKWLALRKDVFLGNKQIPGADTPKGMLLLGVQGCGKSLAAKAVAGSWRVPLLYMDFGALYNRWQGQTEENMRNALETAQKMSPCVLWLDEIEKGISARSASDDTSRRLLATFLTWLAENKHPVFVVATANDVSELPPELMRKGRFDEVFFVDLPDLVTRKKILEVHLKNRDQGLPNDLKRVAQSTDGFSGAELEQLVVSALYENHHGTVNLNSDMLLEQAQKTRPLSVLVAEKIQALRDWASSRATPV
jgi:SpoVK/Ycf46/Vps4 family AAA+-type ATPase